MPLNYVPIDNPFKLFSSIFYSVIIRINHFISTVAHFVPINCCLSKFLCEHKAFSRKRNSSLHILTYYIQ